MARGHFRGAGRGVKNLQGGKAKKGRGGIILGKGRKKDGKKKGFCEKRGNWGGEKRKKLSP